MRRDWLKPAQVGLGSLGAAALLVLARAGPDFQQYFDWSRAFASGDILEIRSEVLTPSGVPHSQWAHGTGLFLSLPQALLPGGLRSLPAAMMAGWLAGLVFWWAMIRLLTRAAAGNGLLALFGVSAAFLGTHSGFYSFSHGSESVGYALAAVLALALLPAGGWRPWQPLSGAAAAVLLIGVRPNLALFAIPAMGVLLVRAAAARQDAGRRAATLAIGWVLLAGAVGAYQLATVNRWMTGEALRSPYWFGEAGFRSVDLLRPQLLAVLAHPWHGWLAYHPLYAIGAAALLRLGFRSPGRLERLGWLALGALILVQLYLQASWYVWWMGEWTFGQRGMAVAAVMLVPALVRVVGEGRPADRTSRRVWIWLSVLACLWSYLLMLRGETSYFTVAALVKAQWEQLSGLLEAPVQRLVLAGSGVAGAVLAGWIQRSWPAGADRRLLWPVALLAGLAISALALNLVAAPRERLLLFGPVAVLLMAAAQVARALLRRGARTRPAADLRGRSLAAGSVVGFLLMGALFLRLAVRTEARRVGGDPPPEGLVCQSRVSWSEVRESYREYQQVPGFAEPKQRLRSYLAGQGAAECPMLAIPLGGTGATPVP